MRQSQRVTTRYHCLVRQCRYVVSGRVTSVHVANPRYPTVPRYPGGNLPCHRPKVLTVARIEAAKPKRSPLWAARAGLPGFYLNRAAIGAKSFALRYRAGGSQGNTPSAAIQNSPGRRRKLAREAVVAVARGEIPGAEKKAARQPSVVPQTIDALVPKFMEDYARNGARKKKEAAAEAPDLGGNRTLVARCGSLHGRGAASIAFAAATSPPSWMESQANMR